MATYNAESALARMIGPHYARAEDEARSLLHEIFGSPADLEVTGNDLHVTIHPLSAPRRTKALAALCEELNATETIYPAEPSSPSSTRSRGSEGLQAFCVYAVGSPGGFW